MSVGNLLRRLQKLEAETSTKWIVFKMPDGTCKKILRNDYLSACADACWGNSTPQAEIVINAVSCNESGKLLELMRMCEINLNAV